MSLDEFCRVAQELNERKVIGRFSTFLEHVKPSSAGKRVTRYNALFHWRVPPGREIEAGREVGRHHILTHAYWREGGPEFAQRQHHGASRTAPTRRSCSPTKPRSTPTSQSVGIPVTYTNVFWGGRSEIKPSEISPFAYEKWLRGAGR